MIRESMLYAKVDSDPGSERLDFNFAVGKLGSSVTAAVLSLMAPANRSGVIMIFSASIGVALLESAVRSRDAFGLCKDVPSGVKALPYWRRRSSGRSMPETMLPKKVTK